MLTVEARTLVPAHAHTDTRAHAHTRLGRWLEATGSHDSGSWRAGAAMGEADAGTPSFEMTWSSTTSSGYCSQEDSDSELEQYFTARTSLARRPRRDQVGAGGVRAAGRGQSLEPCPSPVSCRVQSLWAVPSSRQRRSRTGLGPARGTVYGAPSASYWVPRPPCCLCHRPVEPGEAATCLGVDQGRALSTYD